MYTYDTLNNNNNTQQYHIIIIIIIIILKKVNESLVRKTQARNEYDKTIQAPTRPYLLSTPKLGFPFFPMHSPARYLNSR